MDECSGDNNHCHANAFCTNTFGSYECECSAGYSGDGRNCTGMKRISRLWLKWQSSSFMSYQGSLYTGLSFMRQLEAMPVHRRVGPCSKSPVTIHTPWWTEKCLSEVSCPKKQQEGRAKLRIPDLQIKNPTHQPQFQVGKWNIAIWYQTSWEGSNSSVSFRLITKMTFRALALCRHFPIRLRSWRL